MTWLLIYIAIYLLIGLFILWLLTGIAPGGHQNNWTVPKSTEDRLFMLGVIFLWPYWLLGILLRDR